MEAPDALRAALVRVIADLGREWRRERELIEAQAAKTIAELRAGIAELQQEVREAVAARLAVVKDGEPGRSVSVDDVAPMIRSEVERAVAALPVPPPAAPDPVALLDMVRTEVCGAVEAIYPREMFDASQPEAIAAAVRDAVAALPRPRDGRDADPVEIAAMVQGAVECAVAALPPPEPGRSVEPSEVAALVDEHVRRAVAALPPPAPGKDADPEMVERLVIEKVADAIAALPPAEPGKSVTVEDVAPLIETAVGRAVAALPPAEPGKDADPAEIERMVAAAVAELPAPETADVDVIRGLVAAAVAAVPPAEPGKSVDPDEVREMVREAVAALPPPEPGQPGPPGKLPMVREWADGVHYEADVVTHGGAVYQAQRDTGREPPHEDWLLIAAAGRDGRSMTIRGTWSETEAYQRLDVVALNGASFAARRDAPGPCPGEGWQMIAAQGKRGKDPDQATIREAARVAVAALPAPKKGDPGPPVVAMSVDDEGMLTLVNADGSRVQCDLYPVLAKLGR